MPKVKQLTVACENRPGMLAHIAKALGDAKVNIFSCLATTSGTEGSVRVVVDNVNKAKRALDGAGLSYTETDVLQVELPNTPGARELRRQACPGKHQHHSRVSDKHQSFEEGEHRASRSRFR